MKEKYESMLRSDGYRESLAGTVSDREMIAMLLRKIDQLNERVYEASVRAEDAYQEMLRLRDELKQQ